jgi:hypothetical protein
MVVQIISTVDRQAIVMIANDNAKAQQNTLKHGSVSSWQY